MRTKRHYRSITLKSISTALIVALTTGCSPNQEAENAVPLEPLDILIDWQAEPTYLGIYFAKEQGYFLSGGYDVTITQSWGANQAVAAVANGKHIIGTASGGATILGRNNGANVNSLGVLYPKIPSVVYGLNSSGITVPEDLKGKRVGVYPSSITVNEFDAFLNLNEVQKNDVEIVSLSGGDIPYLLESKVDAVLHYTEMSPVLVETTMDIPTESSPKTFEMKLSDYGVEGYGLNIIANPQAYQDNPAKLIQIKDIIVKGYVEGCANDRKAVESFLELFPDKSPKYVEASWARVCTLLGNEPGTQNDEGWQKTIDLYKGLNLLSVEVSPSNILGSK